jgi:hypothetical protein
MDLQSQLEVSEDSPRMPGPLRRSVAIALVSMVEQPFFRVARGQEGGAAWAVPQAPSRVCPFRTGPRRAPAEGLGDLPALQGLGLFGDTMLERDLAG